MLYTTASCVCLNESTGGPKYLYVILMRCFMVVTRHDVLYFVGNPAYLLVFLLLSGLCPKSVFDHLYVYCVGICW